MCLFPCPISGGRSSSGYCQATYKFWNGSFHLVASKSQNGGSCPGNLVRYSQKNPRFSFLVAFEFSMRPYSRATYKFRRGEFVVLEGCAEDGSFPTDLVKYSKTHEEFSFLVTLEFFGKTGRPTGGGPGRRKKRSAR
jgi:hypothetical protein